MISNDDRANGVGALRLGLVAMIAPLWLLGGVVLVLIDELLIGAAAIAVGLVMVAGAYRLQRALRRPDVVRDERAAAIQHRAGYDAFWAMVLGPSLAVAFSPFVPGSVADRIAGWGGLELLWPAAALLGFAVYVGSIAYHRRAGL